MGISPNIIVARADEPISPGITDKISLFCNVKKDCVIDNITAGTLYEVPLMLHENGLDTVVCRELGLKTPAPDLTGWRAMTEKIKARQKKVNIAVVGKYVRLHDAYLSIIESLNHAGIATGTVVNIVWVDSEEVSGITAPELLKGVNGIIVPGGFGDRGIEGKIAAAKYARENKIPYLGICLGMQIAVIEFARAVGLDKAHSEEFDPLSPHAVIHIMPGQIGKLGSGGTMRLGAYPCVTAKGSLMRKLYKEENISERHRHRFEFNNAYRESLTKEGLVISGLSPDGTLVEAVEIPAHPYYVGVQFHPEFKSRPDKAHPLFVGLVEASKK
jgi:CTP synthase